MSDKGDCDAYYNWYTWNNPQMVSKGTEKLANKRTIEDHPHYSIIKIGQNTEKIPGDFKRLAVTQR